MNLVGLSDYECVLSQIFLLNRLLKIRLRFRLNKEQWCQIIRFYQSEDELRISR